MRFTCEAKKSGLLVEAGTAAGRSTKLKPASVRMTKALARTSLYEFEGLLYRLESRMGKKKDYTSLKQKVLFQMTSLERPIITGDMRDERHG